MNLSKDLQIMFPNLLLSEDECRLYNTDKSKRYYYYNTVSKSNGNKKAVVIMINPSEANEHKENNTPDNTINNLYCILKEKYKDISEFEVVNLYSQINSNPDEIYKQKIEELNKTIVEYVIKKAEIVIPAWGIEDKYNKEVISFIKDIKYLCKKENKTIKVVVNKYPCHFTTQCTGLKRNPVFVDYYLDSMSLAEKIDETIKNDYGIKQKEFENYVFEQLRGKNFDKGFMVFSKDIIFKEKAKAKHLGEKYLYKNRYYYVEKLHDNSNKNVIFILFNPSSSNPEKLDSSVQNCKDIAKIEKYGQIEVLNLFSIRNTKTKDILNKTVIDKKTKHEIETQDCDNLQLISDLLERRKNCDVVLAWGYGKEQEKQYRNRIDLVKEMIKKCGINPKHLQDYEMTEM